MPQEQEELPAERKTFKEIVMRVRKLRWAGMDEEAEWLVKELEQRPAGTESVLPTRLETD